MTRNEIIQEATKEAYAEFSNEVLAFIIDMIKDFEDGYRYVHFSSNINQFITKQILADPNSTIDRDIMRAALNNLKVSVESLMDNQKEYNQ